VDAWTGAVFIWGLSMIPLVFFTTLFYADRMSNRRQHERDQRREHEQMLLQRIQAPTMAVDQHVIQQATQQPRMTPHFDDDEEFHSLMNGDGIGLDPMGS